MKKSCYCNKCDNNIYEKIIKACGTIWFYSINKTIDTNDDNISSCSGCFISKNREMGLFLTAAHCVYQLKALNIPFLYITNPITKKWCKISSKNIYVDNIADIAIIKTDINLKNFSDYTLDIDYKEPKIGDICYIIGNPLGLDTQSISNGIIRDNHFCDTTGIQIVDSLLLTVSGFYGNAGSPILNNCGKIIGVYTFGYKNNKTEHIYETLGGGCNLYTLKKSLQKLYLLEDNKYQKFVGLCYYVINPFQEAQIRYNNFIDFDNSHKFDNKGLLCYYIHKCSPLFDKLNDEIDSNCEKFNDSNDNPYCLIEIILLSAIINGKKIDFGVLSCQRPLGVLLYEYDSTNISIEYYSIKDKEIKKIDNIPFTKTYLDIETECYNIIDNFSNLGINDKKNDLLFQLIPLSITYNN